MEVDEPGQQSKQRELQCQYLEKAPDYFPAALFSFLPVSLVVLLARSQTELVRPFPTGFGMKPTFHQFHAKLS